MAGQDRTILVTSLGHTQRTRDNSNENDEDGTCSIVVDVNAIDDFDDSRFGDSIDSFIQKAKVQQG